MTILRIQNKSKVSQQLWAVVDKTIFESLVQSNFVVEKQRQEKGKDVVVINVPSQSIVEVLESEITRTELAVKDNAFKDITNDTASLGSVSEKALKTTIKDQGDTIATLQKQIEVLTKQLEQKDQGDK